MSLLLAAGADPQLPTDYGWSLLWLAARDGDVETVQLLLQCGASRRPPKDWDERITEKLDEKMASLLELHRR